MLAQCVATLLSLLLSARLCGVDSIQVIAPPSASHPAQMASFPTLRPLLVPFSPAIAQSAAWFMSTMPATHKMAQPAARSQLRGRQPWSRTNPAISTGSDSSAHATSAIACYRAYGDNHPWLPTPLEHPIEVNGEGDVIDQDSGIDRAASSYHHPQPRQPPDPAAVPQACYDWCPRAEE